jgi:hypothetical protein
MAANGFGKWKQTHRTSFIALNEGDIMVSLGSDIVAGRKWLAWHLYEPSFAAVCTSCIPATGRDTPYSSSLVTTVHHLLFVIEFCECNCEPLLLCAGQLLLLSWRVELRDLAYAQRATLAGTGEPAYGVPRRKHWTYPFVDDSSFSDIVGSAQLQQVW